jgi:hypothetical protein
MVSFIVGAETMRDRLVLAIYMATGVDKRKRNKLSKMKRKESNRRKQLKKLTRPFWLKSH